MAKEKKRKDYYRRTLKTGEYEISKDKYSYRWTDRVGKRHAIYANSLDELREKEEQITKDSIDGIKVERASVTLDEVYAIWRDLKRGLKDNTRQNYIYTYEQFIHPSIGSMKVSKIKRSDLKRYYNNMVDERNLKYATVDNIHTVLHQVLQMAVEDMIIRVNPSDNLLRELKAARNFDTEKKKALTIDQQKLFVTYLKNSEKYNHWYPIFATMLGTGLRVGEVTGLRWDDVDLKEGIVNVNHTLVYYNHAKGGCYFGINTPKTESGIREVPMFAFVKDAFMQERKNQFAAGVRSEARVDGYENFVFVNRFGNVQHQGTLNKALRRIIRDCNDEVLLKEEKDPVLLPPFTCHSLRHTYATRLCESGINIKALQDLLGHKDIETTMEVYAEATKDLKKKEISKIELDNDIWAV